MSEATEKDLEQDASLKQVVASVNALRADLAAVKEMVSGIANESRAANDMISHRLGEVEHSAESLSPIAHALDRLRNIK